MRLARIELNGFRCWEILDLELPPGRVALVGPNASGKTSVVEAMWYAATLGSHRAPDAALVMRSRGSAVVRAHGERDGRRRTVELEIRAQGASRVQLDGAPLRRKREALGVIRAGLFAPERVEIVRGDPAERRRFLDEICVQVRPRVAGVLRDYDRILRQRNALLREAGGRVPAGIEVWDAQLAAAGAEVCVARAAAVAGLAPHAAVVWGGVGGNGELVTAYRPNVAIRRGPDSTDPLTGTEAGGEVTAADSAGRVAPGEVAPRGVTPAPRDAVPASRGATGGPPHAVAPPTGGTPSGATPAPSGATPAPSGATESRGAMGPPAPDLWERAILERIAQRRGDEAARGTTLVGPHRDDVGLEADGLPARTHASQGEAWMITLALVIAGWHAVADATGGDKPVLLLDDVLEPLDPARRERVAGVLPDAQVVVTAADPGAVVDALGAAVIRVRDGKVIA